MKANVVLTLMLLLSAAVGFSQRRSQADFVYDIQYLKDSLPERHPNLYFNLSEEDFHASLDRIIDQLDQLSEFETIMALREAVAKIGDPHTNFGFYEAVGSRGHFPVEIFWFSDGIYIMGCQKGYEEMLGKKLVAINDTDIATVTKRASKVVPETEPYFSEKRMHYFMVLNGILNYYDITEGDSAKFTLQAINGKISETTILAVRKDYTVDSFAYYGGEDKPFYWQRVQSDEVPFFREKYFEEDSIYFVQYNRCWSQALEKKYGSEEEAKQMPSFEKFKQKVFATIETRPVKKLLFDMRFNGGGNSTQGTEFINELAKVEQINQPGRLYVGISPHTFSSAVINSMNFRLNTHAQLIGRPTGGKPNHYGEVRAMVLPKTQLEIYHSTQYFEYVDEDIDTVVPDVSIENTFVDLTQGIDPLYEYVKNQPDNPPKN